MKGVRARVPFFSSKEGGYIVNRNTIYFIQRVLTAASSALIYAMTDKLASDYRQNQYRYDRQPQWKDAKKNDYQPSSSHLNRPGKSMRDHYREKEM